MTERLRGKTALVTGRHCPSRGGQDAAFVNGAVLDVGNGRTTVAVITE
jgi:hypothetical protein